MKRGAKLAIAFSACILAAAAIFALVYFVFFSTFTLVSDPVLEQVLPKSTISRARFIYALQGVRLRVRTLDESCFYDVDDFTSEVSKARGKFVLLGPVASSFAASNQINVASLLPSSRVLGIAADNSLRLFDCALESNEASGWIQAAKTIATETKAMSQNVGLVYSSDSITYSQDIISCFGKNRVSVFEKDGSSNLYGSKTLAEMDGQGILLALCPYVTDFNDFFTGDSSVMWVVDYRLSQVVPADRLYGVVVPDFGSLLYTARETKKWDWSEGTLEYCYEKK